MEINENWGKCKLDKEEKRYIYDLILERCPFALEGFEKEELKQFMERYIIPLSINDYIVKEGSINMEIILRSANGIGNIYISRNKSNNTLIYELRIFSTIDILGINIHNIRRSNGILTNFIVIQLPNDNRISLQYLPDDKEVTNFIDNLLQGIS